MVEPFVGIQHRQIWNCIPRDPAKHWGGGRSEDDSET